MTDKLLTIIIPAYNVEDYIDQCMSSLLENEEIIGYLDIIAVNDGSKDHTLEKMKVYESKYPDTVRVIDKENGGHGSGVNRGIAEAKGTYLKVLDSDDWVDNAGLTRLVTFIRTGGIEPDLIINPFDYVWQPEGREELSDYSGLNENEEYSLDWLNECGYMIPLHSATFKTSIFKNNDIPQIDEKISYDDVEYLLFPVPYIESVVYLKDVIYKYRYGTSEQSVSPVNYIKRRGNHKKVINTLLKYYGAQKEMFNHEQDVYYNNRMKSLINKHVNILLSMDDAKAGKREFKEFIEECSGFDLNSVQNKKLQFLVKHNYRWYSLVNMYYRKKAK